MLFASSPPSSRLTDSGSSSSLAGNGSGGVVGAQPQQAAHLDRGGFSVIGGANTGGLAPPTAPGLGGSGGGRPGCSAAPVPTASSADVRDLAAGGVAGACAPAEGATPAGAGCDPAGRLSRSSRRSCTIGIMPDSSLACSNQR